MWIKTMCRYHPQELTGHSPMCEETIERSLKRNVRCDGDGRLFLFSVSDDLGTAPPLGRPLGGLVMKLGDGVHGHPLLGGLWVDAAHRRYGIGRQLVEACERKALELGITRVFAVTHPSNEEARACFEACGYGEMILLDKKLDE